MRILLSKPDHAKHIGKRLSRELDVPLTRGYVIAAKLLGYATWDEFLSECNWSPIYSSSLAAWPVIAALRNATESGQNPAAKQKTKVATADRLGNA